MKKMSVTELKEQLDKGTSLTLIDVREPNELAMASLEAAVHVPIMAIPNSIHEFDKEKPIAVLCHSGVRSAQVCLYLDRFGFDTHNIEGGIHAWSLEVDPSVPTY